MKVAAFRDVTIKAIVLSHAFYVLVLLGAFLTQPEQTHAATILITNSSDSLTTFRTNSNTNFTNLNAAITASQDAFTHPSYGGSATTSLFTLTGGFIAQASSTLTGNFTITGNSTTTFATTTNIIAALASTTKFFIGTGSCTGGSALQVNSVGFVSCGLLTIGAFPFTPGTLAGQIVNATSTALQLLGRPYALVASSTALFSSINTSYATTTFASTTVLTATTLYTSTVKDTSGTINFSPLGTNSLSLTQTQLVINVAGAANAPSLQLSNVTATGLFSPSTGLGMTVNGSEAARFDGTTLNFGIGSTSPWAKLAVFAGGTYTAQAATTLFAIGSTTAGTATTTLFSVDSIGTTTLGRFGACNTANALTTDSSGHILCGAISTSFSYDAWTHPSYGGSATTSLLTLSTGGLLVNAASSTITGNLLIGGNSTTTNATTTTLFATTASSTNLFATAANVSTLTLNNTSTFTGLATFSSGFLSASSTILGNFTVTGNSTTTNATSTTGFATTASSTNLFTSLLNVAGGLFQTFAHTVGIASSSPWGLFSINPVAGSANPAFVVGSSTRTIFVARNTGDIEHCETKYGASGWPATSTSMTLDWPNVCNKVVLNMGTAAWTLTVINATTTGTVGNKLVTICTPDSGTPGAGTFVGIEWFGAAAPTLSTTNKYCDAVSLFTSSGTSTPSSPTYKVFGAANTGVN